jgi:hypothetical protein
VIGVEADLLGVEPLDRVDVGDGDCHQPEDADALSTRGLVLQPHLLFASLVVCASRSGLMASAPA